MWWAGSDFRVETESHLSGKCVKVRVENYEDRLGCYTAGLLSLALHQLPLLEQAVEPLSEKIIPFPGPMSRNIG